MGRRRGLGSALKQIAKASARAQREAHRAAARTERAHQRAAAQAARAQERDQRAADKMAAKEAKARYLESREQEVADMNAQLEQELGELAGIVKATLAVDDAISFDSLRLPNSAPIFEAPAEIARAAARPTEDAFTSKVKIPAFLTWIHWFARRRDAQLTAARDAHAAAVREWEANERKRLDRLQTARIAHEQQLRRHADEVAQRDAEVERFQKDYLAGMAEAVEAYNTLVLERSEYPEALDGDCEVAFAADAGELCIEFDLPKKSCIPSVGEYKYLKAKDSIEEKPLKGAQLRSLYRDVIASICVRTIHEVLEADKPKHLRSVVFNGYIADVNPATGQDAEHCVVSVRARRDAFDAVNLHRVDAVTCLEGLGGEISSRPDELVTVREVGAYGSGDGSIEAVPEPNARKVGAKSRARS